MLLIITFGVLVVVAAVYWFWPAKEESLPVEVSPPTPQSCVIEMPVTQMIKPDPKLQRWLETNYYGKRGYY